ncbi:glutamate--tRNA ligase [Candidatus Woesearchaeota archaeon]|nr:glutamate--tRNA ligase [Candidatus Woesearchaeota archaeon]
MEIDHEIRRHALKNALDYKGKANPGALMGKVIAAHPEWKDKRGELASKINIIVGEVNKLPLEEQRKALEAEAPEMLEKKEKEERNIFAFLGIKEGDKVVTAFPPGPEKYPHIGHAKSLLLNYMLAKQYGGKFILRFEDTNPNLVQSIFYDIMQENFKWLGVEWDELVYASDHMDTYYAHCEKVLRDGDAYVCSCDAEKVRETREKGEPCSCRERDADENIEMWESMKKDTPEGHAIVRLKIDLQHKNTTMRDPTIFRIIEKEHARLGKKYRVWPNYDWQNSIMDGQYGVTQRIRSKEFELRNELQRYIQELLGLPSTLTYEIGRFNMVGVESSGRIIREKIEKGELVGWDDPTLTTLVALRRRGFQPLAIKNFVVSTGISKAEATLTWDDIIIHNKRLLDAEADRYSFVAAPVELWVKGAPSQKVELNLHPTHRKGGRKFDVHDTFWITREDLDSLEEGKLYRLMDCLNFRKQADGFEFDSVEVAQYKQHGKRIMHWLPKKDDSSLVETEVMMPDKKVVVGLAEKTVLNVKEGDVIQFERFGFCRLDKKEKSESGKERLVFWYAHN